MAPRRKRLTAKQAAERLGMPLGTFTAYVSRHQAPQPDGVADPCGCRWWYESTIDGWVRPGRGARTDLAPKT